MKILIIGAGGMIGAKLATRLAKQAQVDGQTITSMTLVDVVQPQAPAISADANIQIDAEVADLTRAGVAETLVTNQPDIIFHLAAVVSGEAEADFDKGYRINLDGTRFLLEAIRAVHENSEYTPTLIFASSIAVYGAPFPETIPDDFHLTPQTSYGTQKAICELLIADYNRRGILQGIGLRLPTICIRPGLPNKAASGFFSNILREPLNGKSAVLPVSDQVKHWFASPRTAIDFLIHATTLSKEAIGLRCNLNLPGLCASVAEQIDALERAAGSDALKLIKRQDDTTIQSIVSGWPEAFDAQRALQLGFQSETSFDEIIKVYVEDELQQ